MEKLMSVVEVAERLAITRVQVFRLIQAGKLKADKVGRNYVIAESDFEDFAINRPVRKAIEDFGETLKRLGDV